MIIAPCLAPPSTNGRHGRCKTSMGIRCSVSRGLCAAPRIFSESCHALLDCLRRRTRTDVIRGSHSAWRRVVGWDSRRRVAADVKEQAPLTLAIRVFPVPDGSIESTKRSPLAHWRRPKTMFVFDTETRVDACQGLTFGSYRFFVDGVCVEEGLFIGDDLTADERSELERYVKSHPADTDRRVSPNALVADARRVSRSRLFGRVRCPCNGDRIQFAIRPFPNRLIGRLSASPLPRRILFRPLGVHRQGRERARKSSSPSCRDQTHRQQTCPYRLYLDQRSGFRRSHSRGFGVGTARGWLRVPRSLP